MPSFQTQRRVRHSAKQMFALVADVEAYPEFLPMCQMLKVLKRDQDEVGDPRLIASMQVGFKAIRETFVSRVILREAQSRIEVEYIDGPFEAAPQHLEFRRRGGGGNLDRRLLHRL